MAYYSGNMYQERAAVPARSLLVQVYAWMLVGLLVTAGVAQSVVSNSALMDSAQQWFFPAIIAQVLVVIVLSLALSRLSSLFGAILFLAYAALNGFTLSVYMSFFDADIVVSAAVTSGAMFGMMSLIGATTNINLSKFSGLLMMAVIGLIIALIVNMFLQNSVLYLLISMVGVLVFTGLTAYDTQRIVQLSRSWGSHGDMTRTAILGALTLYLDLINMFIYLLRLMAAFRN